ncbi:hypothetical protein BT69DRAFT_1298624 [Atractiella rhizophila]|nr:hypothetical protein BT69DRAFT_1298624 [Atractiella rhizophila]
MSITGSEEAYYCDCKTFCGGVWTQIKHSTAFKHESVRMDLEQAGEGGVNWPSGSNNHRTGGMDELRLPAEFEREQEIPESVELCQNSDNFWDEAVGRDLGLSSKRCQEEEDEEKDVEEADEFHSSVDEDSSESDGEEDQVAMIRILGTLIVGICSDMIELCDFLDNSRIVDSRLAQDVWEHDCFIQEQFKLYESMGFTQVVSPEEEYHYHPLAEEEMISVELYMTCHGRAAGEVYKDLRQLHLKRFQTEALTLEAVQKLVRERSHIIPESFDMCSQSHVAYTGLWKD